MALFEALAELVGSAMISVAPACGVTVETKAGAERSAGFAQWLRNKGAATALDTVVDALARDIWVSAETRQLAQQVLEEHAGAVAGLLQTYPPQAAHLTLAIDRSRTGVTGGGAQGDPIARRIAVDIFARARGKGALAAAGLKDDVTLLMVDRVYAHLLDDPMVLKSLAPELAAFLAAPAAKAETGPRQPKGIAALGVSDTLAQRLEGQGGVAYLADLRDRFDLSEKAMRRLLALVDAPGAAPADMLPRLEELARWLGDVRAQLQRPSNEEAEVRRLKTKAAAALADGDLEAAAEALRQVRREIRESRRRTEERLADEVAGLRTQMVDEARATARLAELVQAEGDYAAAADLFGEAALAMPTAERDASWQYNLQRAGALLRRAQASTDQAALNEAIAAYGNSVRQAADGSNQKGLGEASLGLGHALALAGERETGTARLKDAISAYRKAISIQNREGDSRIAAQTQLRLGRVLALAGERDKALPPLREAAQAFREALREISADRQPADHVAAQMGLGSALLGIEEGEGGAPLLTEAASAYAAALDLLSRTGEPELWAEAQMNHGLALLGLGEQAGGEQRLEESAAAFRAALEVWSRTAAPQKWALIHLNLGNALGGLAAREAAPVPRLEEAIAAYTAALEEFRRDSEPLKWAITQMNLGSALIRVGELGDKRRSWLAAAGALVPALEVFEAQGATEYAEVTRRSLRRFHESWDSVIAPPAQAATQPATGDGARPRLTRTG